MEKNIDFASPGTEAISLRLEFDGPKYPSFSSISSLFYNLELLHDFSVISSYNDYYTYNIDNQFFMYKSGRPIKPEHMARIGGISKNSPLSIELVIVALGGLWALVQTVDKVLNWKFNREKLRLDIEKIGLDIEKMRYEAEIKRIELESRRNEAVRNGVNFDLERNIVRRLNNSSFNLIEASFDRKEF